MERLAEQSELSQPRADQAKRKRLGQYFTGQRLAYLLAILANASSYSSIIDPMCGSGDMLHASRTATHAAELFGVEVDPEVYKQCVTRFCQKDGAHASILLGSAFDKSVIMRLPRHSFDLVITNPPYVRYQTLSSSRVEGQTVASHNLIRTELSHILDEMQAIDPDTRDVIKTLINSYSGLSDLAVPSWLLCAMLTRIGGTLAMVVPASWLSRDYSQVIHYLLLKLFKIRWVVEDAHSVWFDDALVNTTLLVAERIPIVHDLQTYWQEQSYLHVVVSGQAMDQRSVVGAIFPNEADPDTAFVDYLKKYDTGTTSSIAEFTSITRHSLKQKCNNLFAGAGNSGWLRKLEAPLLGLGRGIHTDNERLLSTVLPQQLKDLLPEGRLPDFTSLEGVGLKVGQGLRTGANRFFYLDVLETHSLTSRIQVDDVFRVAPFEVDNDSLCRVLRKQAEVSGQYELDTSSLKGRVLVLGDYLLPELFEKPVYSQRQLLDFADERHHIMDEALAHYVRTAATTNIGSVENPRYVPELSAVKTNQTSVGERSSGKNMKFWYMLPGFAPRHIPDLFVARINHMHPQVIKNSQPKTIIDANFSTFWLQGRAVTDIYGFLAILNSSWCIAAMELMGTVMGGGALKLEAIHLRQLPIPALSKSDWERLTYYGEQLVEDGNIEVIMDQVDSIIAKHLCSSKELEEFVQRLRTLNSALLRIRTRNTL